jgi:tRNA-dihydrouridine synthase
VTHLQYAGDSLMIGEASMENLWTMKIILRCFELASCLRVNFAKKLSYGDPCGEVIPEDG